MRIFGFPRIAQNISVNITPFHAHNFLTSLPSTWVGLGRNKRTRLFPFLVWLFFRDTAATTSGGIETNGCMNERATRITPFFIFIFFIFRGTTTGKRRGSRGTGRRVCDLFCLIISWYPFVELGRQVGGVRRLGMMVGIGLTENRGDCEKKRHTIDGAETSNGSGWARQLNG